MIKNFLPRLYQQTIFGTAAHFNTLVVLPTGMGKSAIAFMLAAQRLSQYPTSKILMLAPTKPLCEQHLTTFRQHLDVPPEKIVLFTGDIRPEKREQLWKEAQIIISTPQGCELDLINRRISLEETTLLVIDECHHAIGDYSYVWIAQQYDKLAKHSRILALTASPGSDLEKIKEICTNLKIEKIEVRTEKDPDVKLYIQEVKMNWVKVDFPDELKKVQQILQNSKKSKLIEAQNYGYCSRLQMNKSDLLALQGELQKKMSFGEKDFGLMKSISLIAEALKTDHALELLETQGIKPTVKYFQKLQEESFSSKVKALKNLMSDVNFKAAMYLTTELAEKKTVHPKLIKLKEIVEETVKNKQETKIIIFTQFRDSAEEIAENLRETKCHLFFGQAKKNGLGFTQKEQKKVLDQFRTGEFNCLIATSVAEEGLDIPKVDKVIFYEPIPSAIRSIQRKGRTGRLEKGEVTVLVTANTRDEGYRWSAHHKEKKMYQNISQLKKELGHLDLTPAPDKTLSHFITESQVVAVLADHREKNNRIVKELVDFGVSVKVCQLEMADYLVSGRVAVELKKVPDFVASIIDGRLLDQAKELKKHFEKAVLIIEGEEDIYSVRKVHANAIRGMLASLILDYNIPVLYTKNPKETAGLLAIMAKREQEKDSEFSLHERKPYSLKEQQEFFISALPGVGINTSRLLLENFNSVKNLVTASAEELKKVKGIGEKTAEKLVKLFEEKYE